MGVCEQYVCASREHLSRVELNSKAAFRKKERKKERIQEYSMSASYFKLAAGTTAEPDDPLLEIFTKQTYRQAGVQSEEAADGRT